MANYTLDFTGEEVNELLKQVKSGGGSAGSGVTIVNIMYEGIDENMQFINPSADKTRIELLETLKAGGFVFAKIPLEGDMYIPLTMLGHDDYGEKLSFGMFLGDMTFSIIFSLVETDEGLVEDIQIAIG